MARMCRKCHDHSYSTDWNIAIYISSGKKIQRRQRINLGDIYWPECTNENAN